MSALALTCALLIAGATTRATWQFGYTYLEEWEFFKRNKRLLDVKLPFGLMWIAGTLDATGILKAYILPTAPLVGVALLGVAALAAGVGLFMVPALAYQKQHEYEIVAPDVYIAVQGKAGEASRAYTKALVGAEDARRRAALSIVEAEENLNRARRETARIATSDSGILGTACTGAHRPSTTVMRC